jgi:hypothetical protein
VAPEYLSLTTTQWDGWLAADHRTGRVYFVRTRTRQPPGGTAWSEVMVHVIADRTELNSFSVNEPWNTDLNDPADQTYLVEGVVLNPAGTEDHNRTRILVDNAAGGNVDVVDLDLVGLDWERRQRMSYRPAASSPYALNNGNTLALETRYETHPSSDLLGVDVLFIADKNGGLDGLIRAVRINQPPSPLAPYPLADVDLSADFMFSDGIQGIAVAGAADRLWVCAGTQSFNAGALGEVETPTSAHPGNVDLPYGDQYRVLADWLDPRRVFVATFDGFFNDPDQALYLNLVYDGVLFDTIPLVTGYDEYNGLRGMAFDPYSRRLYLTVADHLYVVEVAWGPSATIFRDGFELGTTAEWSVTVY